MKKKIAVIGLGLIGGSLAKALKRAGYHVIGITRSYDTLQKAKKEKAIDIGFCKLSQDVFKDVDLTFIATPLSLICDYIRKISVLVESEMILSDVGSTKLEICTYAERLLPQNITFIGGHPMAGSENSGFKFAKDNLFVNSPWVLTPPSDVSRYRSALKKLIDLVRELDAIPIILDPCLHDKAVALISHLPLLVSLGLCEQVKNLKDKKLRRVAMLLAASGFKDTTRIAGGNPNLSMDLIVSNFNQLARLLPSYCRVLHRQLDFAKHNNKEIKKFIFSVSNWRKHLYDKKGQNKQVLTCFARCKKR